jgi:hypothetical protein
MLQNHPLDYLKSHSIETQISALPCDSGHVELLIALGGTYYPYGHPALSKDFLRWMYLDNPSGPATLIVAHENDLWIGIIALIPIVLECQGMVQKACFAVNVLTHPSHRTKNLFVKMIKFARQLLAEQGVWLLGHPNANAVPGWKRQKMNFRDPLRLHIAKFNLSLPLKGIRRISSLAQLRELPSSLWETLTERPDMHVKYTPEFISWRFLDAPHKKYTVFAVESRGQLLGLRVTRRFKGPVDLMVDFVAPVPMLGDVLSSVRRPTLVMHSGLGCAASEINKGCWRLPYKRVFPFFVTTWNDASDADDLSGITLVASDL